MNRLRLEHRLDRIDRWSEHLWTALFIDDHEVTNRPWPAVTDLRAVAQSVQTDGTYHFFVCDCGEYGCNDLYAEEVVTRTERHITWRLGDIWHVIGVPRNADGSQPGPVESLQGGAAIGVPREVRFDLRQYAAEVSRALTAGAELLQASLPSGVTRWVCPDGNAAVFTAPGRSA